MDDLLYQYRWRILTILFGLIFVGTGLFFARTSFSSPKVEILNPQNTTDPNSKIFVEVAGSVVNPGVFELDSDSRVEDALAKSGGFTEEADLAWVERTINRAAKLIDGQKIFIPNHSETESANILGGSTTASDTSGLSTQSAVNINTASQKN